jgi:hypothetical protein
MGDRLTTEELAWLERNCDMVTSITFVRRAIAELKERRAADLSAEEREALAYGVSVIEGSINARYSRHDEKCRRALSALSKILKDGT